MNRILFYILSFILFTGCVKKTDFSYDNRVNPNADAASSVRIVNFRGATELMVNGEKLTAFGLPNREGNYDEFTTRGTRYFAENGRMGLTYTIPQQFVNVQGYVDSIRFAAFSRKMSIGLTRPFRAKDDFNHPNDYYYTLLTPNTGGFADTLVEVPRSVSSPVNPQYFKVRLLNLSSNDDVMYGAMGLTLADGTPVTGIGNVAPGKYSGYAELPFGTYQLRVLTADGRQVPGVIGGSAFLNVLNPKTGTLQVSGGRANPFTTGFVDSKLVYAPVKTFQPGGVYTIAVASYYGFEFPTGGGAGGGETANMNFNSFRIITDYEPQNIAYARLQAVNVIEGTEMKITVDEQPLKDVLAFTASTEYERLVTGTHTLKVTDGKGNTLAEKSFQLSPGDNLTAWVYKTKAGETAVCMAANNLSGILNNGKMGDDGTYNSIKWDYPFFIRCLNFCPELPEVTFTQDDGRSFYQYPAATQHIRYGVPVTTSAFAALDVNFYASILAYASQPNVLPGDWLREIKPLKSQAFIANPALYRNGLPFSEGGYYTVALVGNTKATARLIVIKHNK